MIILWGIGELLVADGCQTLRLQTGMVTMTWGTVDAVVPDRCWFLLLPDGCCYFLMAAVLYWLPVSECAGGDVALEIEQT